jgi:DNA-binding transcriptional ArsR family regulator
MAAAALAPAQPLECIDEPGRARALLDPLRLELVRRLREPRSTTELAADLGLARQGVLYHLKALHKAALLRKAGRRQKRGFEEQRWVASAESYVLGSDALGPAAAEPGRVRDRLSAGYLLALAAELTSDLARALRAATEQKKRIATLAISAELRFESAAQRERFTAALRDAIVDVIDRHASPAIPDEGEPQGRPYRLMLGCWPVPADARTPFGRHVPEENES